MQCVLQLYSNLTKGSIRAAANQKRKENTECLATCLFFFHYSGCSFFSETKSMKDKILIYPTDSLKIKLLSLSISVYGL